MRRCTPPRTAPARIPGGSDMGARRNPQPTAPQRGASRVEDPTPSTDEGEQHARERFGGLNVGAAFFGWLVAVAISILLTSIVGALVAALGSTTSVTQSEAQRAAGTIGLASALVLVAVLLIGYHTGGYVAGRMSRFDGGRQGAGVWLIGLLVTVLAIVLGGVFGAKYNVLDRVNLPRMPVNTDTLSWGAVITALVILVLTFL